MLNWFDWRWIKGSSLISGRSLINSDIRVNQQNAENGELQNKWRVEKNWGIFIVQQTLIFQGNISFVWQEPRLSHRSDPLISPTWKDKRKKINERQTENPLSCTRKSSAFLLCDYFWLFYRCGVVMGGGFCCWQLTFVRFVSHFPQKEWKIIKFIHQSAAGKEDLKVKCGDDGLNPPE